MTSTKVAIACQGGGSHCAFTGGVLAELLRRTQVRDGALLLDDGRYEIIGLSGTSGGAISAYLAWLDLLRMRSPSGWALPDKFAVQKFWEANRAQLFAPPPYDLTTNLVLVGLAQLEGVWPMLSGTPNLVTRQVQDKLRAMIVDAAGDLAFLGANAQFGGLVRDKVDALAFTQHNFPLLLIGAADIDKGEFEPFIGTPSHPPVVDQVMASTALPDIFAPVALPMAQSAPVSGADAEHASPKSACYWDGLFSQNPPISDLMSPNKKEAKPDEIWIVRINPAQRSGPNGGRPEQPPLRAAEIYDRRNEMAGNLSLEQEKSFVRKINKMCDQDLSVEAKKRYKKVALWGMALEGQADQPEGWRTVTLPSERKFSRHLDHASKLLRGGLFIDELMQIGCEAAVEFLAHRRS